MKCWYENPTHRPSFADLVIELELLLEDLTSQVRVTFHSELLLLLLHIRQKALLVFFTDNLLTF